MPPPPLTTIAASKEFTLGYQPLLLFKFTFLGGLVLRVCAVGLNATEAGLTAGGDPIQYYEDGNWVDYEGRVLSAQIAAIQALAASGLDAVPMMTLTLDDPDGLLWNTYESEIGPGWKGAKLTAALVLWEPGTRNFSSDAWPIFEGTCNSPMGDELTLSITAVSRMNMAKTDLPVIRFQKRCPWVPPVTADQRIRAEDPSSVYYPCGTFPGDTMTECARTPAACVANLRWDDPASPAYSRWRFGGIQWQPRLDEFEVRQAGQDFRKIKNNGNDARYNDYVPILYGTARLDPPIMNVVGEGNWTHLEVVIGYGQLVATLDTVPGWTVIVNGRVVSQRWEGASDLNEDYKFAYWRFVSTGAQDGRPNMEMVYGGKGDPYGSMCVIHIAVAPEVASSESLPAVQVIASGAKVRVYKKVTSVVDGKVSLEGPPLGSYSPIAATSVITLEDTDGADGTYTVDHCDYNPPAAYITPGTNGGAGYAWVEYASSRQGVNAIALLMDVLTWANWRYADFDRDYWIRASDKCEVDYSYMDQHGVASVFPLYRAALALRERRSITDLVNGLRNNCRALLIPGTKLRVQIKETLASQQPSAITGSNYNTPISSVLVDGTAANGYVAYHFDESNVKVGQGGVPQFSVEQRPIADTPNRLGVMFQNKDNDFSVDTLSVIEEDDVYRLEDQEYTAGVALDGVITMSQARRCLRTMLAELHRGNPRSAVGATGTSGTWMVILTSTVKAAHLRVGDLVAISWARRGLDKQLFRVQSSQVALNYEEVRVRATWHEDAWYLNNYGDAPDDRYNGSYRNRWPRGPFTWQPYYLQTSASDLIWAGRWTFGVGQIYKELADGTGLTEVTALGRPVVNDYAAGQIAPPALPQIAAVAGAGSLRANSTYYVALVSKDLAGATGFKSSPPSHAAALRHVATGGGADTYALSIPLIHWGHTPSAVGWLLFVGTSSDALTFQAMADTKPASSDADAALEAALQGPLLPQTFGMPDCEFDRFLPRVKRVYHSGVFGMAITGVDHVGFRVQVYGAGWSANQWAGRVLLVMPVADGGEAPLMNYNVVSNDSQWLTLDRDPVDAWIGDAAVVRFKVTAVTATSLTDVGITVPPMNAGEEKGRLLRFLTGAARGLTIPVEGNSGDTFEVGRWPVQPAIGDLFIVEAVDWDQADASSPVNSSISPNDSAPPLSLLTRHLPNYLWQTVLVQIMGLDGGGKESISGPWRELFIPGMTVVRPSQSRPFKWQPYRCVSPQGGYTFGLVQTFTPIPSGGHSSAVEILGLPQVNIFAALGVPVVGSVAETAGGAIPAGTYRVALAAQRTEDGVLKSTPVRPASIHEVTLSATGSILLDGIEWAAGTEKYKVFVGATSYDMTECVADVGTPGSITVAEFKRDIFGAPDPEANRLRVKLKKVLHSGVWGMPAENVGTDTLEFTNATWTDDELIGRSVVVLSDANGHLTGAEGVPLEFLISGNTATVLVLTDMDGNAVDLVALGVEAGDAAILRMLPDLVTATTYRDPMLSNSFEPTYNINAMSVPGVGGGSTVVYVPGHTFKEGDNVVVTGDHTEVNGTHAISFVGLDNPDQFFLVGVENTTEYAGVGSYVRLDGMRPDEETGRQLRIIRGAGIGQSTAIVDNGGTEFTLADNLGLDLTSVAIVEEAGWFYEGEGEAFTNALSPDDAAAVPVKLAAPASQFIGNVVLVAVFTVNADGGESPSYPWREIYLASRGLVIGQYENVLPKRYLIKDHCTFNVGMGGPQPVGVDIAPHYPVQETGFLFDVIAVSKAPGADLPLYFDIGISSDGGASWVEMFGVALADKVIVPVNDTGANRHTNFVIQNYEVNPGDIVRIGLAEGSSELSEETAVVVRWGHLLEEAEPGEGGVIDLSSPMLPLL